MKPIVVLMPQPQPVERIFRPETLARLHEEFDGGRARPARRGLDAALADAWAVVGQPDLPAERLERAPHLRAVLNVEGNFYPNVDYPTCFARSIRVLGCGPAYAQAVAEHALGLALDLARGISREDRAFRAGRERYLGEGNADAVLLRHADVGLVGYGNLGRALRPLLAPVRRRPCASTTPGCRTPCCARPTWSRPASTRCSAAAGSSSCSPPSPARASTCSARASSTCCPRARAWCWSAARR